MENTELTIGAVSTQTNEQIKTLIDSCVNQLAKVIGERNDRDPERYVRLGRTRDFIVEQLAASGADARLLPYHCRGVAFENIEVRLPGSDLATPEIVVGAHYDSARKAPGANDNGTGVACLLALAHLLAVAPLRCPVRLVGFTNEEPPHTRKPSMGSLVYARALSQQGVSVRGMISLETLSPLRSRLFKPVPLFVVGNLQSRRLSRHFARLLGDGTNL
jgi:Zn-dependent M28 family amino/carboxypeptidase